MHAKSQALPADRVFTDWAEFCSAHTSSNDITASKQLFGEALKCAKSETDLLLEELGNTRNLEKRILIQVKLVNALWPLVEQLENVLVHTSTDTGSYRENQRIYIECFEKTREILRYVQAKQVEALTDVNALKERRFESNLNLLLGPLFRRQVKNLPAGRQIRADVVQALCLFPESEVGGIAAQLILNSRETLAGSICIGVRNSAELEKSRDTTAPDTIETSRKEYFPFDIGIPVYELLRRVSTLAALAMRKLEKTPFDIERMYERLGSLESQPLLWKSELAEREAIRQGFIRDLSLLAGYYGDKPDSVADCWDKEENRMAGFFLELTMPEHFVPPEASPASPDLLLSDASPEEMTVLPRDAAGVPIGAVWRVTSSRPRKNDSVDDSQAAVGDAVELPDAPSQPVFQPIVLDAEDVQQADAVVLRINARRLLNWFRAWLDRPANASQEQSFLDRGTLTFKNPYETGKEWVGVRDPGPAAERLLRWKVTGQPPITVKTPRLISDGLSALLLREALVLVHLPDGVRPKLRMLVIPDLEQSVAENPPFAVTETVQGKALGEYVRSIYEKGDSDRLLHTLTLWSNLVSTLKVIHEAGFAVTKIDAESCLVTDDEKVIIDSYEHALPLRLDDRYEALFGKRQGDERDDVLALGELLKRLLKENKQEDLPPLLEAVILKMTAEDPDQRYQTLDELEKATDRVTGKIVKDGSPEEDDFGEREPEFFGDSGEYSEDSFGGGVEVLESSAGDRDDWWLSDSNYEEPRDLEEPDPKSFSDYLKADINKDPDKYLPPGVRSEKTPREADEAILSRELPSEVSTRLTFRPKKEVRGEYDHRARSWSRKPYVLDPKRTPAVQLLGAGGEERPIRLIVDEEQFEFPHAASEFLTDNQIQSLGFIENDARKDEFFDTFDADDEYQQQHLYSGTLYTERIFDLLNHLGHQNIPLTELVLHTRIGDPGEVEYRETSRALSDYHSRLIKDFLDKAAELEVPFVRIIGYEGFSYEPRFSSSPCITAYYAYQLLKLIRNDGRFAEVVAPGHPDAFKGLQQGRYDFGVGSEAKVQPDWSSKKGEHFCIWLQKRD